jgi:hypothetical protein
MGGLLAALGGRRRGGGGGGGGRRAGGGAARRKEDPDMRLPTSQTCSFNLVLPRYTSYEKLVEKLEFALQVKTLDGEG